MSIDKEFIENIDNWINSIVIDSKFSDKEVYDIINMDMDSIYELPIKELESYVYNLLGYLDSLHKVMNKEKSIINYADKSIWFIIAPAFDSYGSDYTQGKMVNYNRAIRDNDIASALFKLKNAADSRAIVLESRIFTLMEKIKMLQNILRRRSFNG